MQNANHNQQQQAALVPVNVDYIGSKMQGKREVSKQFEPA